MVGHAPLREVVGADLLGALARAHLRAALGRDLRRLLGQLALVQAGAQHPHRLLPVLKLGLLVLHRDDDPGRLVREAHGRVRRVDGLPARPRGAVDVHLEVVRIHLDLDLLGLREHGHGRRRGVDPALGLRLRHALHAVGPALVLEDRVGAVALDGERRLLEAADVGRREREVLGLKASVLGVAGEHLVEVAGEQGRLVPARAGAELDDHVLLVVGIRLDHRQADRLLELLDPGGRLVDDRAQLRVVAVLGEQLAGALQVVTERPPPVRSSCADCRRRYSRPTSA